MQQEEAQRLLDIIAHGGQPSMEDALAHFGVKGMKWGVRKREDRAAAKTAKAEKKQARKDFKVESKEAHKVFQDKTKNSGVWDKRMDQWMRAQDVITQDSYNKLSTKDLTIKKGSTLYRTTQTKDGPEGATYVSTNRNDADIYRAILPKFKFLARRENRHDGSIEQKLEAVRTLKSPSEKARVDAFIELMDTPSIQLKNGKTISGRELLKRSGFRKEVKRMDAHTLGLQFYVRFTQTQGIKDAPLNTAYYNKLKEKGYNAVIDDNDRGIVSKDPWIVMDGKGDLKQTGVTEFGAKEVNAAMNSLKLPDKDARSLHTIATGQGKRRV